MISIKRRKNRPRVLDSEKVQETMATLSTIVETGDGPKSGDFENHWLNNSLRNTLWEQQHKKCSYCELIRGKRREIDVEHFRPKAKVDEDETHPGYWWLAYEWNNLLYSCKYCNQEYKKNRFPLLPNGLRARTPNDNLRLEYPSLLNPYEDDTELYFSYDWVHSQERLVQVIGIDHDQRGAISIEVYGLNRIDLAEQRADLIETLKSLARAMDVILQLSLTQNMSEQIMQVSAQIKDMTASRKSFSGFRRYYFRSHGLGEFVSND